MKTTLKVLAFLVIVCATARTQVMPAATGPGSLPVANKLNYTLRYSQVAEFGGELGDWQTSTLSGSVDFANASERLPFYLDYTGDYAWSVSGPAYGTGYYQRLFLSQGINLQRWKFVLHDDASYRPEAPTTGFLGIPGLGEPIGTPSSAPSSSTQSILTVNTHAVENFADGEVDHNLSRRVTLSINGNSDLLRYPNDDGINTNAVTGTAQLTKRFNVRNALMGAYQFNEFSYPGYNLTFQSNTALFGYEHRWTRNLSTNLSAGPEWINSSNTAAVPSSTNVVANASINYQLRLTSAGVGYKRGTNGGAGYLLGGEFDTVTGNLSREFRPSITIGLTGGYEQTSSLNNSGTTKADFGGAQVIWRINRNIIAFANYTGVEQTSTAALPGNALSQLLQVVGFGVGYSPRQFRRRQ